MSEWLRAAKLFEENSHEGSYFEAQSAIYALRRIQTLLETSFPQMFFLLGEPGSGKSFMLHHLYRLYKDKRLTILIENPFLTPEQLLKRLLCFQGISLDTNDIEALRLKAIEAYRGVEHLIMFDEAQLMSPQLIEFIRILSDSKVFYFLMAMHKKEGEELLSYAHFYSRPYQLIYLGQLEPDESISYLTKELQVFEKWNIKELFSKSLVKQAWGYSKGNFRDFKKCFYHLFLLLDYAKKHNKKEFLKPNALLMRMAAIRGRVLAAELNSDDFEVLQKAAKEGRFSKRIVAGALLILLVVGFGAIFTFYPKKSQDELARVDLQKPNEPVLPSTNLHSVTTKKIEPQKSTSVQLDEEKSIEPISSNQSLHVKKQNEIATNNEALHVKVEKEPKVVDENKTLQPKSVKIKTSKKIEGALPLVNPNLPQPTKEPAHISVLPYNP